MKNDFPVSGGGGGVLIGWREWVGLPGLALPALKAKIDTGARTSCLHAVGAQAFDRNGESWVRFAVHPVQRRGDIVRHCEARVIDRRVVKDSGGHSELRYVIAAALALGGQHWPIELTLTNRSLMQFRMLLGREALRRRVRIDPGKSFLCGKRSGEEVMRVYAS